MATVYPQACPNWVPSCNHVVYYTFLTALRYELLLKELSHLPQGAELAGGEGSPAKRSGLTHTRVNTCFQILGRPHGGPTHL